MGRHLVLVGGGHAHLTVLKNLRAVIGEGHRVTLVSPSEYHYYSGMGPGMLGGFYRPQDIRFHVAKTVRDSGGTFLEGRVVRIDAAARQLAVSTEEGERTVPFDVASFNIGSDVPDSPVAGDTRDIYPVKPVLNLLRARERLQALARGRGPVRVVVAGGGPAGFEVAGNARAALGQVRADITVVAGSGFLNGLPDKARQLARLSLARRGISILEGARVERLGDGMAVLSVGRGLPYDLAFLALGVRPPSLFRDSGLPTGPSGGLLVDAGLRSVGCPDIFGGGDCIDFQDRPLDKVGVFAVRENPVLYNNLLARLRGDEIQTFNPGGKYLLVYNCGDGTGVLVRAPLVFDGKLAFTIKDWIDRKFMRTYQVSGERSEPAELP